MGESVDIIANQRYKLRSKKTLKYILFFLFLFTGLLCPEAKMENKSISFSEFLRSVEAGDVKSVVIYDSSIIGVFSEDKGRKNFVTHIPYYYGGLIPLLYEKNVEINGRSDEINYWLVFIRDVFPFMIVLLVFYIIIKTLTKQIKSQQGFDSKTLKRLIKEEIIKMNANNKN